jgi:hypothetical protein
MHRVRNGLRKCQQMLGNVHAIKQTKDLRNRYSVQLLGSALVCNWVRPGEKYRTVRNDTIFMEGCRVPVR